MLMEAVLVVGDVPRTIERRLLEASSVLLVRYVRSHDAQAVQRAIAGLWRRESIRDTEVLVLDACGACPVPDRVTRVSMDEAVVRLRTLETAHRGWIPAVPHDPIWLVEVHGADPMHEHMHDTRLAMVDGVIGTLGSPLVSYAPARRDVLVAGVYAGTGPDSDLLRMPDWTRLDGELLAEDGIRRVLDLRTGFLHHEARSTLGVFRALTFASRALPGVGVLHAQGEGARAPRGTILPVETLPPAKGREGTVPSGRQVEGYRAPASPGGAAVATSQSTSGRSGRRRLDRMAAYVGRSDRVPTVVDAERRLRMAERLGVEALIRRQRASWSRRWQEMGVRIVGDPALQHAINFALFHLDSSIARGREAPLGPRGLSGPSYKGHVFWDSEVFVLPFFAATRPAAARAMLEYRVRRIGAAQEAAREAGLGGAWFPWESAADGRDVTPPWVPGPTARPIRIWTGERELHVVADIAWAAREYVAWSGDHAFAWGGGLRLLVETARFWASRLERDADGSVHLRGIIGPDEYHELVDDNAFTNVMARWNLRQAAATVTGRANGRHRWGGHPGDPSRDEVADWLDVAARITDGYDAVTGIYEQFAGFHSLEPLRISELTSRPAWADVLLGRERVSRAQVVKQTDVLLLHHLVPDEVVHGSLERNLDYYEPRTAHGSSLSPGTHAALLARAGRFAQALDALRMAAFMDLDDRNGTAAEGLHIQTMGGLWQALVMGFGGIRPSGDDLVIDPRLPPAWDSLEVPVRFRGRSVRIELRPGSIAVRSSGSTRIRVPGLAPTQVGPRPVVFKQRDDAWYVSE